VGIPCESVAERVWGKQCEKYVIFWLFLYRRGEEGEKEEEEITNFPLFFPFLPFPSSFYND
jgi:hypothetical protein